MLSSWFGGAQAFAVVAEPLAKKGLAAPESTAFGTHIHVLRHLWFGRFHCLNCRVGINASCPVSSTGTVKAFTLRDLLILAFYNKRIIAFSALNSAIGRLGHGDGNAHRILGRWIDDGVCQSRAHRQRGPDRTGPTVVSVDGLKLVESEIEIIQSDDVIGRVVDDVGAKLLFPDITQSRLFGLLSPTPADAIHRRAVELFRREMRAEVRSDTNIIPRQLRASQTAPWRSRR